jgi:2',3'-cyclic-nucleotide 2'-phosphodiesterase/3'-nucleotidase
MSPPPLGGVSDPEGFDVAPTGRDVHLRLLYMSDLHAHLHPWDYGHDRPAPGQGLAAIAALVEVERATAPNHLLFDGGDLLQGAPLGDLAAADAAAAAAAGRPAPPHPVIAAMNAMGFAAGTFGNHDFNFGLDMALDAAGQGDFPMVLANVRPDGCRRALPPRWVALDRTLTDAGGAPCAIRIGVTGFCPPQVSMWDGKHLNGRIATEDVVESARSVLPQMRAAGCDLIIALCHSGICAGPHVPGMENAALQLARLGLADVILTGHQHMLLPGMDFDGIEGVDAIGATLAGTPALMPPHHGEGLGVMDLRLRQDEGGRWHIAAATSRIAPTGGADASLAAPLPRAVMAATETAHQRTLAAAHSPAGRLAAPLHSWFALVADSPAVHLVNLAQRLRAEALVRGTKLEGLPLLSAAAPFRAGWRAGAEAWMDLPAGPLSRRHLTMLYPFPNVMWVIEITGEGLRLWLERSAAIWAQVTPGARDTPLIDPRCAPYNFDVIDGLSWEVDLTAPAMFGPEGEPGDQFPGRIRDLRHRGVAVTADQSFALATNAYRAGGGGRFPGLSRGAETLCVNQTVSDILLDRMQDAEVDPTPAFAWRLTGAKGSTAVFRSSVAAPSGAAAARAAGGLALERIGEEAGFGLYRLHL